MEDIQLIMKKYGWDVETCRSKISNVSKILNIEETESVQFLLVATPPPKKKVNAY